MIQGSDAWKDFRRQHIGASEAGILMGVNPYSTPVELWEEKCLGWEKRMSDAMMIGQKMEPIARDAYQELKGISVEPAVAEYDSLAFISASFDGINFEKKQLVEIKCGKSAFRQAKRGGIPSYYHAQMMQQMVVADVELMDYFCFEPDTHEHILIPVEIDHDFVKRLLDMEVHFWQHIVDFIPPEESCCNWSSSLTKPI
jgi:putative phage-type endonuclease